MAACDEQSTEQHRSTTRVDAGTTLVEIVVSIVLIGSLVAAMLAAVFTMVRASSTVFEAGRVETALLNAADLVDRAEQQCDYTQYVQAAAEPLGWDTSSIRVTGELLASNTGSESTDWVVPDCLVTDIGPFDVQRLTITATDPSGRITRTLTVVKSSVN